MQLQLESLSETNFLFAFFRFFSCQHSRYYLGKGPPKTKYAPHQGIETYLPQFDMKMVLTHTYATAISATDVFTTEYPAFSSDLIIERSFLFLAISLVASAPVS